MTTPARRFQIMRGPHQGHCAGMDGGGAVPCELPPEFIGIGQQYEDKATEVIPVIPYGRGRMEMTQKWAPGTACTHDYRLLRPIAQLSTTTRYAHHAPQRLVETATIAERIAGRGRPWVCWGKPNIAGCGASSHCTKTVPLAS
jgi:hypothetical protein